MINSNENDEKNVRMGSRLFLLLHLHHPHHHRVRQQLVIVYQHQALIVIITMSLVRFGDMVPGQNDMGSGGMGLEQIAKMTVITLFCSTDVHCENIEKWL